jgi:2-dehydro-3-deoxygalactonokinase
MMPAMSAASARFIAVDWGTTRLRAYLAGDGGEVFQRSSGPEGISALAGSGFAAALKERCGRWLERFPAAPVLMAGMIGSRNGWLEAPYLECPASLDALAGRLAVVTIEGGRRTDIVPGLKTRNNGVADVLRGEETLLFGAAVTDGLIVLPGTHCKWALMENGRLTTFRTYMTGEFYGLLRDHSILRLLADTPADESGFARGLEASGRPGSLLHRAFETRTAVLDGAMPGKATLPFLSGLLIGEEISAALSDFGATHTVTLIADGDLARNYREGLVHHGIAVQSLSPEGCFIRGAARILDKAVARR